MKNKTYLCKNCNKICNLSKNKKNKYCSNKCQKEFENKKLIKQWLDDDVSPLNQNKILKPYARKYLIKKANYKCEQCGWNKKNIYSNKIPLEIDHIDGNYKNNKIENLRVLCPNCHSLTSTYKNSNKGNGRKNRIN